jgi:hypothetical protein
MGKTRQSKNHKLQYNCTPALSEQTPHRDKWPLTVMTLPNACLIAASEEHQFSGRQLLHIMQVGAPFLRAGFA